MDTISSPTLPHIALFPFMAKGHTMPLIHLAHLIDLRKLATITFFTTPLNAQFVGNLLSDTDATIVMIPFPQNVDVIPPNTESTDQLPSSSLFIPFVNTVKLLQPQFERSLKTLLPDLLISDGFLGWTNESATKFGIPRIAFYGMGNFAWTFIKLLHRNESVEESPDGSIRVLDFPRIRLTSHDLVRPLGDNNSDIDKFVAETEKATEESRGLIVNSFYELEGVYFDYYNSNIGPKAWCVGPVCLVQRSNQRSGLIDWLDSKLAAKRPVLFVAFGTQADVTPLQLREIAIGLELSGLDFLWVVRTKEAVTNIGFEERVAERGKVVREWVDQIQILRHASVKGFVSHCGWNSVLEAVTAGVPVLAWPMMAEQHLNAKFVVDEIKIGIRIRASDGTRDGIVKGEDVMRMVRELIMGERAEEMSENVKALGKAAEDAVGIGGSSWLALELMIKEVIGEQ